MSGKTNMNYLEHIGVMVSDLEKSKKFYCDVLGFKFIEDFDVDIPQGVLATSFVELGGLILHLEMFPEFDTSLKAGLFHHICLNVDDIHAVIEDLKAKGVKFEAESTFTLYNALGGNMECIFFRGPDNELIELCQRC